MPATIVGARRDQTHDRLALDFGHVRETGEEQLDRGQQQRIALDARGS